MSKVTQKEKLIELLKRNWMSSFQMQQAVMSSGADRTMRRIRECPPEGYVIESSLRMLLTVTANVLSIN